MNATLRMSVLSIAVLAVIIVSLPRLGVAVPWRSDATGRNSLVERADCSALEQAPIDSAKLDSEPAEAKPALATALPKVAKVPLPAAEQASEPEQPTTADPPPVADGPTSLAELRTLLWQKGDSAVGN